jgi:hypothetical protein
MHTDQERGKEAKEARNPGKGKWEKRGKEN